MNVTPTGRCCGEPPLPCRNEAPKEVRPTRLSLTPTTQSVATCGTRAPLRASLVRQPSSAVGLCLGRGGGGQNGDLWRGQMVGAVGVLWRSG